MPQESPTVLQARIEMDDEIDRHVEARKALEAEKKKLTDQGNVKHKDPATARALAAAVEVVNQLLKEEDAKHNRRKSEIAKKMNGGTAATLPGTPPATPPRMPTTTPSRTYEFSVGSIGWINAAYLQPLNTLDMAWALGDWSNKVLIGLHGTSNPRPPTKISKLADDIQRMRQYRCLIWCTLRVTVDVRSDAVIHVEAPTQILDPGYTPPFDFSKVPQGDQMKMLAQEASFRDRSFHAGEMSPVSEVVLQGRHRNSTLFSAGAKQQVVASALLKFRAGATTDAVGIRDAKCPYHVPWTWTELLVTYQGSGEFACMGAGACFPTQALYVNGEQRGFRAQKLVKHEQTDPAFTTGMRATMPKSPTDRVEPNSADQRQAGLITQHPYTLAANSDRTYASFKPLVLANRLAA